MPADQYFDGFSEKQQAYERELAEQLGDKVQPHIEESRNKVAGWTKQEFERAMAGYREGLERLAERMHAGMSVDAPEVQAIIAGHRAWLTQFWTPDPEAYAGLGEMYATDPRFRDPIDDVAPGLADFLRDAMRVHAETAMS